MKLYVIGDESNSISSDVDEYVHSREKNAHTAKKSPAQNEIIHYIHVFCILSTFSMEGYCKKKTNQLHT